MVAFNRRHLSRTVRSASATPQVDHARRRRVDPSRSISERDSIDSPTRGPLLHGRPNLTSPGSTVLEPPGLRGSDERAPRRLGARQALRSSVAEALRAAHPAGGHQAATFSGTASNGAIRASLSSLYVPTILHVPSSSRWTFITRDSRSTTHA